MGLVHGRMKPAEKAQVMAEFKAKIRHHTMLHMEPDAAGILQSWTMWLRALKLNGRRLALQSWSTRSPGGLQHHCARRLRP